MRPKLKTMLKRYNIAGKMLASEDHVATCFYNSIVYTHTADRIHPLKLVDHEDGGRLLSIQPLMH